MKKLSLSSNGLRCRAPLATSLASAALTLIDFSDNPICGQNAVYLAEALSTSNTLRQRILARCALGRSLVTQPEASDRFSASLANTVLVELDLTDNMLGLWLFPNAVGIDCLAEPLKTNTTLQVLNLSSNNINDRGGMSIAAALEANSSLVRLNLSINAVGQDGATHLADVVRNRIDALKELNLARNEIAQVGYERLAEILASNSSLSMLTLGDNPLGSGASWVLSSLMSNWTLSRLEMEDNLLSADLVWMSEMLSSNSTLTMINVDGNFMGDLGAFACAEALMINSSLTALSLGENDIRDCGAERLAEALMGNSSLTHVQLAGNKIREHRRGARVQFVALDSESPYKRNRVCGRHGPGKSLLRNQILIECRLTIEDAQMKTRDFDMMLVTFAEVLSSPCLHVLDLCFAPSRSDDGGSIGELKFARALKSFPPHHGASAELSSSLDPGKYAPRIGEIAGS